jgi:hypothetical protein
VVEIPSHQGYRLSNEVESAGEAAYEGRYDNHVHPGTDAVALHTSKHCDNTTNGSSQKDIKTGRNCTANKFLPDTEFNSQ